MEEKERKIAEEDAMNKLVKEILKNGDVKTVFDVENKLKQSFGKVIQSMLEAEMEEHLGRERHERSNDQNQGQTVLPGNRRGRDGIRHRR